MKFYEVLDGELRKRVSLWDILRLEEVPHRVISIVGAGGKTSTMYRLAEECRERGKKVVVTTSTHIANPKDYPVLVFQAEPDAEDAVGVGAEVAAGIGAEAKERADSIWQELERLLEEERVVVAAGCIHDGGRKLAGMPPEDIGRLSAYCDVLLVEADGSKQIPLKVPERWEPVIIKETDVVIGCVGLTCIGRAWEEACFRWKLAGDILQGERKAAQKGERKAAQKGERKAGQAEEREMAPEEAIRPSDVARILLHENGTRKCVDGRPYRIVLNQADEEEQKEYAREIAKLTGAVPVAVTSYFT